MQLAPLMSHLGVVQACVAPDTGELFSCSIYRHERNTLSAPHWHPCAAWSVLRTHYLSDGLCTLITRTFDDLEVGRVGLDRTEKLVKLSNLVDFCRGEIFPVVIFPAKEPCMQTTILKWHTFILSVAEFLSLSNCSCRPWNSKKCTKGLYGPWQTRTEQISYSYRRTSESCGRECLHRDGLRLYARETAVHANPYTPVTILATEDTILRDAPGLFEVRSAM